VAHQDGVTIGYPENIRTGEVVYSKARGQHSCKKATSELLGETAPKRYERRQAEQELYETPARQLDNYIRGPSSGAEATSYHGTKWTEATRGAPMRNGDVLVPGYDSEGKLWTVQYIQKDGTKRFAKESRKHGCFHVIGAANGAAALQKIVVSSVVVIAKAYATAVTISKDAKVAAIVAFYSGNCRPVATALHGRWPGKAIIIVADGDYQLENNPGSAKAMGAAKGSTCCLS
jgi:putative DNA primase/helicase